MGRLIAIDPGTRLCGFTLFEGLLPKRVGVAKSTAATLALRAYAMGTQIMYVVQDLGWPHIEDVVVERPVIYPGSRERDSDMMDLAVAAGVIGGIIGRQSFNLTMPTPREWKGTVPKGIHNERTKVKCPAAVALVESTVPKSQQNHVWDAVGLALWQIERDL